MSDEDRLLRMQNQIYALQFHLQGLYRILGKYVAAHGIEQQELQELRDHYAALKKIRPPKAS